MQIHETSVLEHAFYEEMETRKLHRSSEHELKKKFNDSNTLAMQELENGNHAFAMQD